MSVPKKRRSKQAVRQARTHKKIKAVSTLACPNCKAAKLPHRACGNCGQQKGKTVLSLEKRDKRSERKRKTDK